MEYLQKIILEKTNEVFKKSVKEDYSQEVTLLNTYFYWSEFIGKEFSSKREVKQLFDEATLDLVSSLFNTFSGFYRQGMVSLRSSLELTALFVYYFDHPIEFEYFVKEKRYRGPLLSELINKGDFLVKKYCLLFVSKEKLKKELHTKIEDAYKRLSLYVHGRLSKLQTFSSFQINFRKSEFSKFMQEWKKVIGLGNTILSLRFYSKMSSMDKQKKEAIHSVVRELGILEV